MRPSKQESTINNLSLLTQKKLKYSLGKSVKTLQFKQKLSSIKQKCLPQSPIKFMHPSHSQVKEKNRSLADQQIDMSYISSSQEETDDAELQTNHQNITIVRKSKFPGRPPTIHFSYPQYCEIPNKINKENYFKIPQYALKYRIYGSQYRCIMNAFEFNGFKKGAGRDWDVFFDVRGSQVKRTCSSIGENKKFNHFAGCWHLGRKDKLWRGIQRLRKSFPNDYSFVPKTYIFPFDYERFQMVRQSADKDKLWIQKPVASACGRAIKLVKKETPIRKKANILISEYISNPHLINNLKYDLRLYVVVTSFNPLRIYLFEDGLVRFATQAYNKDKKDIKRKFIHLTNFSINKHSKRFIPNNNKQSNQKFSKWSLKALRNYYIQHGINHEKIFSDIEDVIIKTCVSAQSNVLAPKFRNQDRKSSFFQLYGFDILIDDQFKPWLLEVNVCPSLCSSSPLDRRIKHTLLTDLLNLIGIQYEEKDPMELSKMSQQLSPKVKEKEERRRYRFKNSYNINNLCYDNCVELLQPEDWLIIFQTQEEMERKGHFKRIFPTEKGIKKFQKHFQCIRYSNLILWRYLLSVKNFLHRINL